LVKKTEGILGVKETMVLFPCVIKHFLSILPCI
jgi:hypothetical protein